MATDGQAIDFLISLAEIAGVFVGFGVLIGAVQRMNKVTPARKALAQAISMIGLAAMLTALLPPTLREFGLSGQALWFYASIGFFVIGQRVSSAGHDLSERPRHSTRTPAHSGR